DRYLRGLLESELPVDSVIKTQEIDLLTPRAASTLSGNIAVADAGISASTATSMTLRAGVNVDDAVDDGQSLWLHMNEASGATTFADASLNGHDLSCNTCPTATGSALRFSATNQTLSLDPTIFDLNTFSVGMWVKQVSDSGQFVPFMVTGSQSGMIGVFPVQMSWRTEEGADTTNVSVSVARSETIHTSLSTSFNNWPGTWQHLMLTYDRASRSMDFYLNGVSVGSSSNAIQIDTSPTNVLLGFFSNAGSDVVFEMDEFEFFPRVLDANTILSRYGSPLRFDLTQTGNGVSCDGDRCPSLSDSGATFDQTKHLTLDTSSLNFSNNQFSIAVDVNPQQRANTFTTNAGDYFGIDTSQDWQGVYGYRDPSNDKRIFPSLFVGSNGALRVDMGDGTNICSYQTADGIVEFGVDQHIGVSYDGSAFTIYINGEERASGTSAPCGNVQILDVNQLYAGRANAKGYLYFDNMHYETIFDEETGDVELRINLNSDKSSGNIWHDNNVSSTEDVDFVDIPLGLGRQLTDGDNFWFLVWEDDGSSDDNDYDSLDDNHLKVENITNYSPLARSSDALSHDDAKGTLYWSLSNEFFVGRLRNVSIFDYALSPTGAERVYNTETFALQMDFDEAPGATTVTDSSGNYFEAGCAGASCPDSGIPGRWN
ncbi:MAG: laminin G domain-containing protein, partial [Caldilineaceae bacterium]|nr:laminin G domain-containing protein [Caldilineaceae bacterium]